MKKTKLTNAGIAVLITIVVVIVFAVLFLTTKYDVSFNPMGGTTIPKQTLRVFSQVKKPADPTREGYTFDNWYYNDGVFDFSTRVTSNMILEARWIEGSPIVAYTVTFNSNGGSSVSPIKVNEGSTVTKPADPTREGYTFKGWQNNGKDFDFKTKINSNIVLVAVWELGSSQGGNTGNQGGTTTKPTNPSKPNGGNQGGNTGNQGGNSGDNQGGGTTTPEEPDRPITPEKPTYSAVCEKVADSAVDQCIIKIKSSTGGYVNGIVKITVPNGTSQNVNTGFMIGTGLVKGLDVVSVN